MQRFTCEFCGFRAEEYTPRCGGCGISRPVGRYGTLVIRRPHAAASATQWVHVFFDGEDHIRYDLLNGSTVTQGLEVGIHQVAIRASGAQPKLVEVQIWPGGTHTYEMSFSALGGLNLGVDFELAEVSLPVAFPPE